MTDNPLPGLDEGEEFTDRLRGSVGSFVVEGPSATRFLTTTLGVGKLGVLRTAREVVSRERLRVGELLQREIDEKRINEQLLSYLTSQSGAEHVRFFPPLVAAVLSKKVPRKMGVRDRYPERRDPIRRREADRAIYEHVAYGDHFQLSIPLRVASEEDESPVETVGFFDGAVFHWHRERVDLLVIDGQHRLLALRALHGQLEAEDRRYGIVDDSVDEEMRESMKGMRIPLCLLYPENLHDGVDSPVTLFSFFRQVFVDVNKNAQQVGEARNILLNERDMFDVFTRSVVDSLTIEADLPSTQQSLGPDSFPLYMVDWEANDESYLKVRAPALTSIGVLKRMVEQLLVGEGPIDEDEAFRTALGVEFGDDVLDPDVAGEGVPIDEVTRRSFSHAQFAELKNRFDERWSSAVKVLVCGHEDAAEVAAELEQFRTEASGEGKKGRAAMEARFCRSLLLGTAADQRAVHTTAADDDITGQAAMAAVARHQELLDKVRDMRRGPFARLLLTNVGQTELCRVFSLLWANADEDDEPYYIAKALVDTLNELRAACPRFWKKLFDRESAWNVGVLERLGTGRRTRTHVSVLLRLALTSLVDDDEQSGVRRWYGEDWPDLAETLSSDALEELREHLLGVEKGRLKLSTRIRMIREAPKRRATLAKQAEANVNRRLSELHSLAAKNDISWAVGG